MKPYTLLQADYRETLASVAGQADLVFTSPPYADARTYNMACNWTDADYAALGDAVFAALKPGGHALINVDAPVREWRRICDPCGKMTSRATCPGCDRPTKPGPTERGFHPWTMQKDWAERVGFRVPDRLAFGRQGLPGEYLGRFRNDWEPLLWFQKPGDEGWFDRHSLVAPSKTGVRSDVTTGVKPDGTTRVRAKSGWATENGLRHRGTLWDYVEASNGGAPDIEAENHPARWPYKLAEDIVRCFCPPDGLAVDPFVGCGTSLAAAIAHGRRFHGGDLGSRTFDPAKPHLDAVPWVTVAERVITQRLRQQRLFP